MFKVCIRENGLLGCIKLRKLLKNNLIKVKTQPSGTMVEKRLFIIMYIIRFISD